MDITVIITHYRSPALLKLCLDSVRRAVGPLWAEVIVSDSAFEPETTVAVAAHYPEVSWIRHADNVGYAKLVNDGLSQSTGQTILVLNADIILFGDTIRALVGYLAGHPKVAVAGPQLLNIDETRQDSAFRFYTPAVILSRRTWLKRLKWFRRKLEHFRRADRHGVPAAEPVDWLMGSALVVRREAIQQVGPMDESFFMYFEDVDWCRRFWEAGWEVHYVPEAKAIHYHQQQSRSRSIFDIFLNPYTRIHVLSAMKYFLKYGLKVPRYGA
ncbi:glycosyltransferase family 2 protein [Candidatus Parcubacteria bacterium]|nr:glycosyltransferase family 2 protein [Candidatus Parcubacteria bacterium]